MDFRKLKFRPFFDNGLRSFLDLLCPQHCIRCAVPFGEQPPFSSLCEECQNLFAIPEGNCCPRCSGKRSYEDEEMQVRISAARKHSKHVFSCANCRRDKFVFSHCIGLGEYRAELRAAVLQMKNERSGRFAIAATRLFHELRREKIDEYAPELLIPVPMHFIRRMFRGLNGPEIIARELSRLLEVPCSFGLLKRTKATKLQRTLNPKERRNNLEKAISLNEKKKLMLSGKRILLLDDILTTGATANACAKLLLNAGATSVCLAVIARTTGKD